MIYHDFSNRGHLDGGRLFSGFPSSENTAPSYLAPRGALRLDAVAGDLIRLDPASHDGRLALLAFSQDDGTRLEANLGWDQPEIITLTELDESLFQAGPLRHFQDGTPIFTVSAA